MRGHPQTLYLGARSLHLFYSLLCSQKRQILCFAIPDFCLKGFIVFFMVIDILQENLILKQDSCVLLHLQV